MDKLDRIIKEIEHEMNEIKKLPPEERLERIKKLEKLREEELKKAESLKEESIFQIEKEKEETQTEEANAKEQEDKKTADRKRQESTLEEEVAQVQAIKTAEKQENISGMYKIISGDFYTGLADLRNKAASGNLSEYEIHKLDSYRELIEQGGASYQQKLDEQQRKKFDENLTRAEQALKQIETYKSGKKQTTYQSGSQNQHGY